MLPIPQTPSLLYWFLLLCSSALLLDWSVTDQSAFRVSAGIAYFSCGRHVHYALPQVWRTLVQFDTASLLTGKKIAILNFLVNRPAVSNMSRTECLLFQWKCMVHVTTTTKIGNLRADQNSALICHATVKQRSGESVLVMHIYRCCAERVVSVEITSIHNNSLMELLR